MKKYTQSCILSKLYEIVLTVMSIILLINARLKAALMGTEIERKFLIISGGWQTGEPILYLQGYLSRDKHRTVRIRVAGGKAMLTVKGITIGFTRAEYEYSIPLSDAMELLKLCDGSLIEKRRWFTSVGNMTWEIDEFMGDNQGLVVAEIELNNESQSFEMPSWLGKEVTDDARYYNSNLITSPFNTWNKSEAVNVEE